MSGIYIHGLEMPGNCWDCPLIIEEERFSVCLQLARVIDDESKRPSDCPIVPVPDHGDLIEREPLRASIKESIDECHKWAEEVNDGEMYARVSQSLGTFVECSLRVKAAPTIIPADKEAGE